MFLIKRGFPTLLKLKLVIVAAVVVDNVDVDRGGRALNVMLSVEVNRL